MFHGIPATPGVGGELGLGTGRAQAFSPCSRGVAEGYGSIPKCPPMWGCSLGWSLEGLDWGGGQTASSPPALLQPLGTSQSCMR